jgi:hypothetical protein
MREKLRSNAGVNQLIEDGFLTQEQVDWAQLGAAEEVLWNPGVQALIREGFLAGAVVVGVQYGAAEDALCNRGVQALIRAGVLDGAVVAGVKHGAAAKALCDPGVQKLIIDGLLNGLEVAGVQPRAAADALCNPEIQEKIKSQALYIPAILCMTSPRGLARVEGIGPELRQLFVGDLVDIKTYMNFLDSVYPYFNAQPLQQLIKNGMVTKEHMSHEDFGLICPFISSEIGAGLIEKEVLTVADCLTLKYHPLFEVRNNESNIEVINFLLKNNKNPINDTQWHQAILLTQNSKFLGFNPVIDSFLLSMTDEYAQQHPGIWLGNLVGIQSGLTKDYIEKYVGSELLQKWFDNEATRKKVEEKPCLLHFIFNASDDFLQKAKFPHILKFIIKYPISSLESQNSYEERLMQLFAEDSRLRKPPILPPSLADAPDFFRRISKLLPHVLPVPITPSASGFGLGGTARAKTACLRAFQLLRLRLKLKVYVSDPGNYLARCSQRDLESIVHWLEENRFRYSRFNQPFQGSGQLPFNHHDYAQDSHPSITFTTPKHTRTGQEEPPYIPTRTGQEKPSYIPIYWTTEDNWPAGPIGPFLKKAFAGFTEDSYKFAVFYQRVRNSQGKSDYADLKEHIPFRYFDYLDRNEFNELLANAPIAFVEGWSNVQFFEASGKPFFRFGCNFDTFFDYTHLPADLLKSKMSIEGKDFERFQKIHEQYLRVNAFFTANLSMEGFQRKYPGYDKAAIEREAIEVIRAILSKDDDWTQYFKIRQCVYYNCQADLISASIIEQLRNGFVASNKLACRAKPLVFFC